MPGPPRRTAAGAAARSGATRSARRSLPAPHPGPRPEATSTSHAWQSHQAGIPNDRGGASHAVGAAVLSWMVGSGTGRPAAFQPWVFPSPPTEPDVPVSEHPALHEPMPVGYDVVPAAVGVQGVGMLAPR